MYKLFADCKQVNIVLNEECFIDNFRFFKIYLLQSISACERNDVRKSNNNSLFLSPISPYLYPRKYGSKHLPVLHTKIFYTQTGYLWS